MQATAARGTPTITMPGTLQSCQTFTASPSCRLTGASLVRHPPRSTSSIAPADVAPRGRLGASLARRSTRDPRDGRPRYLPIRFSIAIVIDLAGAERGVRLGQRAVDGVEQLPLLLVPVESAGRSRTGLEVQRGEDFLEVLPLQDLDREVGRFVEGAQRQRRRPASQALRGCARARPGGPAGSVLWRGRRRDGLPSCAAAGARSASTLTAVITAA